MLPFWNERLRFPVLMALLLFMGMMPKPGFGEDVATAGNDTSEIPADENDTSPNPRDVKIGTPMKKIKCYDCSGDASSDCAIDFREKLKKLPINECEGACTKTVSKEGFINRTCNDRISQEHWDCLVSVIGSFCREGEDAPLSLNTTKGIKYDQCVKAALSSSNARNEENHHEEEIACECNTTLCNPADHSSPNKTLIISIVLMAAVYLSSRL